MPRMGPLVRMSILTCEQKEKKKAVQQAQVLKMRLGLNLPKVKSRLV